jgi:hypothetical protein
MPVQFDGHLGVPEGIFDSRRQADDPHRLAVERLHDAFLDARRVGGDAVICDGLDMLGAGAGQARYRYAAAAIRGLPPGRAAINDDRALQRILKFAPVQRRSAIDLEARDMAGAEASGKQVHAIKWRLSRKLKKLITQMFCERRPPRREMT